MPPITPNWIRVAERSSARAPGAQNRTEVAGFPQQNRTEVAGFPQMGPAVALLAQVGEFVVNLLIDTNPAVVAESRHKLDEVLADVRSS